MGYAHQLRNENARVERSALRRCGDVSWRRCRRLNALRSSAHVVELYFQPRGGEIPWYTDDFGGRRDRPD